MHYLKKTKELKDEECYEKWTKIKNGIAKVFESDEEQRKIEYNRLLVRAIKKQYDKPNYNTKLSPVLVYKEELDALNDLDAPLWVKQYWMCLLVYHKFAIQVYESVQKTRTLNSWALRQTNYRDKRYGSIAQDRIAEFQKKTGKKVVKDYPTKKYDRFPVYEMQLVDKKKKCEEVAIEIKTIDKVQEAVELVKDKPAICTECGKPFAKNAKTKRTVCEECYMKKRRALQKKLITDARQRNRTKDDKQDSKQD